MIIFIPINNKIYKFIYIFIFLFEHLNINPENKQKFK